MQLMLILHNIRSAHNVGSLLRTADGAGVSKVFLTGFTPAPLDRFGREDAKIAKVALGAEKTTPWETREIGGLLAELKAAGVHLVALEQTARAVPYDSFTPRGSAALILGSEVGGIEESLLERADTVIEIPMRGEKDSLNVSVAGAIALYELTKHRQE